MTMPEYYIYPPDVTPESHPDHHVVGREFGGHDWQDTEWRGKRWFCYSHDAAGYNMYCTDGSGHWTNISERAIGRSFHEIHKDPDGRVWCSWFSGPVPKYTPKKMVLIDPATGLRTNV